MEVVRKEKQIKEVDVTVECYNLCDKCNNKIEVARYDVFECELIHKVGTAYPEGGSGDEQTMELCQKCAYDLVELLRENGYRITDREWDF
jgi:hypothetical protein